ncbi:MAG: hypothetical protein EXR75_00525 [Myxococcales bacterium]|nr:hypothetical protein [Myxococcales bacterium]
MKLAWVVAVASLGLAFGVGCAVEYDPELDEGEPDSALERDNTPVVMGAEEAVGYWCPNKGRGMILCEVYGKPPAPFANTIACSMYDQNGNGPDEGDCNQLGNDIGGGNGVLACQACCLACYGAVEFRTLGSGCGSSCVAPG